MGRKKITNHYSLKAKDRNMKEYNRSRETLETQFVEDNITRRKYSRRNWCMNSMEEGWIHLGSDFYLTFCVFPSLKDHISRIFVLRPFSCLGWLLLYLLHCFPGLFFLLFGLLKALFKHIQVCRPHCLIKGKSHIPWHDMKVVCGSRMLKVVNYGCDKDGKDLQVCQPTLKVQ